MKRKVDLYVTGNIIAHGSIKQLSHCGEVFRAKSHEIDQSSAIIIHGDLVVDHLLVLNKTIAYSGNMTVILRGGRRTSLKDLLCGFLASLRERISRGKIWGHKFDGYAESSSGTLSGRITPVARNEEGGEK